MADFWAILQQEGVSLQSEGLNDVALAPSAARRAIAALRVAQAGISGGETWRKEIDFVRLMTFGNLYNTRHLGACSQGSPAPDNIDHDCT